MLIGINDPDPDEKLITAAPFHYFKSSHTMTNFIQLVNVILLLAYFLVPIECSLVAQKRFTWECHRFLRSMNRRLMSTRRWGLGLSNLFNYYGSDGTLVLYTKYGDKNGTTISITDHQSLISGGFNPNASTVITTHGFLNTMDADYLHDMKKGFLKSDNDVNYFIFGWDALALNYWKVVRNIKTFGEKLGKFISFLKDAGADEKEMHLIGFSLGAHLVAEVANNGHQVGRITGLDPAGPCFEGPVRMEDRLNAQDADIVDVIHTSTAMWGYKNPLGTIDYYANGGEKQPQCCNNLPSTFHINEYFESASVCNHYSAHKYFIKSLEDNYHYLAVKCRSEEEARNNKCNVEKMAYMGLLGDNATPGIYYAIVKEKCNWRFNQFFRAFQTHKKG